MSTHLRLVSSGSDDDAHDYRAEQLRQNHKRLVANDRRHRFRRAVLATIGIGAAATIMAGGVLLLVAPAHGSAIVTATDADKVATATSVARGHP